jgi:hypothetical protein
VLRVALCFEAWPDQVADAQVKQAGALVDFVKSVVTLFRNDRLLRQALHRLQEASPVQDKPLVLITDVCTRWNYTAIMLQRFFELSDFVKEVLQQCASDTSRSFSADHVNTAAKLLKHFDRNVADVQALLTVLGPCKAASDDMESDKGLLSQLLFVEDSLELDLGVSCRRLRIDARLP